MRLIVCVKTGNVTNRTAEEVAAVAAAAKKWILLLVSQVNFKCGCRNSLNIKSNIVKVRIFCGRLCFRGNRPNDRFCNVFLTC